MDKKKKPLIYLGGDIMTRGSNLARQEEYDEMMKRGLNADVYSPVMNKSINDKSNMTVEQNNHLAEKIVSADTDRLWKSDIAIMCPEQSALGTLVEVGQLLGWRQMSQKLMRIVEDAQTEGKDSEETLNDLMGEIQRIYDKREYYHYFDIRTNHLPEVDWRRSFSINQYLYGAILATSDHPEGIQSFESIMDELTKEFGGEQ